MKTSNIHKCVLWSLLQKKPAPDVPLCQFRKCSEPFCFAVHCTEMGECMCRDDADCNDGEVCRGDMKAARPHRCEKVHK